MIILTRSKRLRNKGWHKVFKFRPVPLACGNEFVLGWVMQKYVMGYESNPHKKELLVKYMKVNEWSWASQSIKREKCND